jgi:hypothetical protein
MIIKANSMQKPIIFKCNVFLKIFEPAKETTACGELKPTKK